MNKATMIARYLLGIIFLIFGTNGLLMILTGKGFLPMPPAAPEMQAVMGGFFAAGYLMPLVKFLQVVSAVLLLTNKYVNLALMLLAPIIVNIVGIHIFVDMGGLPIALLVAVLWAILFQSRRKDFLDVIKA